MKLKINCLLKILLFFGFLHQHVAYAIIEATEVSPPPRVFKHGDLSLELGGYIKNEGFFDSRQVFGYGDDQALLYPDREVLDTCGNDINAHGQYDMVPIETVLHLGFKGLKVRQADVYGAIEANFFGRNEVLNIFGMYNTYIDLAWETVDFKAGQWWHPIFVLECYPNTISNNSGTPIAPFSRNPQVYVKKRIGNLDIIAAALSQIDFVSDGPLLTTDLQAAFLDGGLTSTSHLYGFSSTYLRNSMVPMLHFQLQGRVHKHVVGAGVDFKRIVPRIITNEGFKARESLNSFCAIAYMTLNGEKVIARFFSSYAQNGTDYSFLGGYAVKTIDWVTDNRTYANLSCLSFWMDIESRNKKVQPGLFLGVTKNLGANSCIVGDAVDGHGIITERRIYGFQPDIDTLFRISPRLRWNISEHCAFGAELEYTYANYGFIDRMGKVRDTTGVGNTRFLCALYYFI